MGRVMFFFGRSDGLIKWKFLAGQRFDFYCRVGWSSGRNRRSGGDSRHTWGWLPFTLPGYQITTERKERSA
jgi:hypothetical protein